MDVKVLKLEDAANCVKKIQIELTETDISLKMNELFDKIQKTASLPGFRPGKVPRNMLISRYKKDVKSQAIEELLPEAFEQISKDNNLDVFSQPIVTDLTNEEGQPVICTLEVELKPQVKLGDYSGISVKQNEINITEQEIDDVLKRLQEQHAAYNPVSDRKAIDGDLIHFEMKEKGSTSKKEEKGETTILGQGMYPEEIENALKNLSIEESTDVIVTYPADHSEKNKAGKTVEYQVKLKEVKTKVLPNLDDDFAKDLGKHANLSELKDAVKKDIQLYKENREKESMENQLLDELVNRMPMDLPMSLVYQGGQEILQRTQQNLQMQGLTLDKLKATPEQMAQQSLDSARKSITAAYIIDAIATKENIVVTDEEFENDIKSKAEGYGVSVDKFKEYLNQSKKLSSMKHDMLHDKVVNHLLSLAKVDISKE